jgi:hypothetical protein
MYTDYSEESADESSGDFPSKPLDKRALLKCIEAIEKINPRQTKAKIAQIMQKIDTCIKNYTHDGVKHSFFSGLVARRLLLVARRLLLVARRLLLVARRLLLVARRLLLVARRLLLVARSPSAVPSTRNGLKSLKAFLVYMLILQTSMSMSKGVKQSKKIIICRPTTYD